MKSYYHDDPGFREQRRQYVSSYQLARKITAVSVLGGKCQRCGWNDHPAGLQFHHREPSKKLFHLSSKTLGSPKKYPWDVIVAEIDKCDLLCANCHSIEESAWDLEGVWPV